MVAYYVIYRLMCLCISLLIIKRVPDEQLFFNVILKRTVSVVGSELKTGKSGEVVVGGGVGDGR